MLNAETILKLASEGDSAQIAVLAEAEIRDKAAKAKGGATLLNRTRAAVKYLKENAKSGCKRWAGCAWAENGKQCFTNGYTAFMLNEPLPGLPVTEEDHMNISTCFPDDFRYIPTSIDIPEITAALKIYQARNGKKAHFRRDIEKSHYNVRYLLDCYNILGGDIVLKVPANGELTPAVLESENGKALLMPERIHDDEKRRVAC